MKSYSFLFWGYLAVWSGLTVYLTMLVRRLTRATRRIEALESRGREARST